MSDMSLAIASVRFGLDLALMRAQVAAQNIAQANRPSALFSGNLTRLQAEAMSQHIQFATPQAVSLDAEVEAIVAASGRYQALIDGLSRQLALMQIALGGRR